MSFKNTILTGPAGKKETVQIAVFSETSATDIGRSTIKPGDVVFINGDDELSNAPLIENETSCFQVVLEGGTHVGEDVDTSYAQGSSVRVGELDVGQTFNGRVQSDLAVEKNQLFIARADERFVDATFALGGSLAVFRALEASPSGTDRLVAFKRIS